MENNIVFFAIVICALVSLSLSSPIFYQKHHPYKDTSVFHKNSKFVEHFHSITSKNKLRSSWGDIECVVCKILVEAIQVKFGEGKSKKEITDEITRICIDLGLEDVRVCIAIVRQFENEVLTVIDKLVLNPEEVCGTVLGSACGTPYNPLENWNVSFPDTPKPPVVPPKTPATGSPKLRVLHISDIHHDTEYKPGSKADCNEPMCCRGDDGKPDPGIPGAGKWGDYRYCDIPLWTLENLFQHLNNISSDYDYIMWTGDLPAHNIWNQSRSDQLALVAKLTQLFKKYFPNKKIYSSLGNHESSPVNSFPPPFINNNNSISWLYSAIADSWLNWLPSDTKTTIQKGSYYVVSPYPGLRIISINTNYCNNQNWWLLLNTTDPAGQLQWLIDQLQDAENSKEKVHILGHIPPGLTDCLRAWSWNYYNIVNRYESTIAAQFFGHTHKDEFEVFYDNVKFTRPVSIAYVVPSVTPYHGLNIGYRIYQIDGNYTSSSWSVLDHETYILNLTEANAGGQPTYKLEYTAKETLGMKSLYAEDWSELIYRMKDNSTLFDLFYSLFYKSNPDGSCDDKCKKNMLCRLKSARSHDPSLCFDI